MINYRLKTSNLKLEVKVLTTYVILFVIVFVASALFGNGIWSASTAAIIMTIAVVSALFLTGLTATTIPLIIAAGLRLIVITPTAMFTGIGTGVLTKAFK